MCYNVVHVCVMFLLFVVCLFLIFLHKTPHGAEHADFKSAAPIGLRLADFLKGKGSGNCS